MTARIPVSVIVMTKNEEMNLAKCLASAGAFAECFVVDSNSSDRTCDIARERGARLVEFAWDGKYPKKKQWCLETLGFAHDWVLYLDADEELTPALTEEIRAAIADPAGMAGFYVSYDYVFLGRTLRHGHRARKLVLLNRHKSRFAPLDDLDATHMWEVEGHYQPLVDGAVGTLRNAMIHDDHDELYHYFERHNRYSDWEAAVTLNATLRDYRESMPASRRFLKLLSRSLPCRPLLVFLHSYVMRLGFLDGAAGFNFAVARAFYYWQIGLKLGERKARMSANGGRSRDAEASSRGGHQVPIESR